ncbi:hypothetical protein Hypma_001383 [Hypsizygus marmoreus]|uniref:Velvet domain-containing protein n=1 Tax=Hypsizygus marmoreus TaxID=39966 RepID=A0A369K103_HYPMA|nr:hypothetical protein Hypma_001383 [Hypsizygus marmoreus]
MPTIRTAYVDGLIDTPDQSVLYRFGGRRLRFRPQPYPIHSASSSTDTVPTLLQVTVWDREEQWSWRCENIIYQRPCHQWSTNQLPRSIQNAPWVYGPVSYYTFLPQALGTDLVRSRTVSRPSKSTSICAPRDEHRTASYYRDTTLRPVDLPDPLAWLLVPWVFSNHDIAMPCTDRNAPPHWDSFHIESTCVTSSASITFPPKSSPAQVAVLSLYIHQVPRGHFSAAHVKEHSGYRFCHHLTDVAAKYTGILGKGASPAAMPSSYGFLSCTSDVLRPRVSLESHVYFTLWATCLDLMTLDISRACQTAAHRSLLLSSKYFDGHGGHDGFAEVRQVESLFEPHWSPLVAFILGQALRVHSVCQLYNRFHVKPTPQARYRPKLTMEMISPRSMPAYYAFCSIWFNVNFPFHSLTLTMFTQFQPGYQQQSMEPPAAHNSHQPHGTDLIGQPILFVSGQFAGQTIRAELREVQQAELGRKYARVDRRPLDPPPVVQLRLYQVFNAGTDDETEKEIQDYDAIQVLGLLCTVDLFPVPPQVVGNKSTPQPQKIHSAPPTQVSFASSVSSQFPDDRQQTFSFVAPAYNITQAMDSSLTSSSPRSQPTSIPDYVPYPLSAPDIVHYVGNYPVTENSKTTQALVGATFVQPASVEFQGQKSIMFVFADLAVKVEGTFILRYRVFDIFSKPHNREDLAIQAECYGGPFRVYSTKEFPGLQASTELTKQLARWGVRLNTRETERKRRKKGEARSASPPYTGTGKRKVPSPNAETTWASGDD